MMQVCLYRHRRTKKEVEAAEFTGNNFLAMNTWTGERLKYVNVRAQRCQLSEGQHTYVVEVGDWVIKDGTGRWFAYPGRHFKTDYLAVEP